MNSPGFNLAHHFAWLNPTCPFSATVLNCRHSTAMSSQPRARLISRITFPWRHVIQLCALLGPVAAAIPAPAQAAKQTFEINVAEQGSMRPLPCRIHLKDDAGTAVRVHTLPFFRDHFVCPGTASLELAPGTYRFEIERGPEYALRSGTFAVAPDAPRKLAVEMERVADLAAEGWWSGELHVHRPARDIELLMRAEDLHVAPVMTWWNNQNQWTNQPIPEQRLVRFDGNRFHHLMAGEDEREGGALLYFNLPRPLAIAGSSREFPSPMKFLAEARQQREVWVDVEKPFWWDAPLWFASGMVDSVGLANNHMCRDQMYETEAWGRARDAARLPAPRGNGYWTQEIYYHLLNCGLRLPPSAGSASGVLPNPVGYNRVYVHLGNTITYEKWWEGLRAGRSFVSNGPLLRCRANGELPGHVFSAPAGGKLTIKLTTQLTTRENVPAVEVIKNGRVAEAVRFAATAGERPLAEIEFTESGWFLVRAVTDTQKTFRFASTAPFYVQVGEVKRRVSRASAQFFLDWVRERQGRIKLPEGPQRVEVLRHHEAAEKFWREKVAQATVD